MTTNITVQKAQPTLVALFVSDVHLQEDMPLTKQAFFHFLKHQAPNAQQLYVLGDLFEYWIGDDDLNSAFAREIAEAIRAVSDSGTPVFWIAGNRDFLVGEVFAAATGMRNLADPSCIDVAGQRIVLTHGDAYCTEDVDYMRFRTQVRGADWQTQFLSLPTAQRQSIVHGLRHNSKMQQQEKSMSIMDVNLGAISDLFHQTSASIVIHGHTHRPAIHTHAQGMRYVLPDWDCDVPVRRGGWLALYSDTSAVRYSVDGDILDL